MNQALYAHMNNKRKMEKKKKKKYEIFDVPMPCPVDLAAHGFRSSAHLGLNG
jgi:hypothetical protein